MMVKNIFILAFVLAILSACATTEAQKTAVTPQTKAHDFTLPDQNGQAIKLSDVLKDYRGVVLAFYPKDDSKN